MLLRSKHTYRHALAAGALMLGLATVGCTDDEPVEEVIQPEVPVEPAAHAEAPELEPAPVVEFTPETIYFAFDDYTLSADAQGTLESLANHMRENQGAVVQVEGHCDERGSIEYNLALGERRAQSVKNYLTQLGVDSARLSTISYGEEKPALPGSGEGSWGQNRRAEFTVTAN